MPGTAFAWKRIERALKLAAYWRARDPAERAPGPPGPGGTAGDRAAYYERQAAELIATGMRRRAAQSQTPGAREQRRRRARLGPAADPRTAPDRVGRGRGHVGAKSLGRGRGWERSP